MKIDNMNGDPISKDPSSSLRRRKLQALFAEDPNPESDDYEDKGAVVDNSGYHCRSSYGVSDVSSSRTPPPYNPTAPFYSNPNSTASSPYNYLSSPWSQPSPYTKSPWLHLPAATPSSDDDGASKYALIGSLVREEGHVYSLAAAGDLLYTGSDSKNVRVWKNLQEFSGFKSSSGLLKAIVLHGDRIFTGHQDGKIRVWKYSGKRHRRIGSLPTARDLLVKSINPRNYVEVRRHRSVPWVKHYDAVSCLGVDKNQGLLYSGSWDKTLKVWRISDSKCLESIPAHEDAVNAVEVAFDGLVFTGSADGTVKAWRRELVGRSTRHVLVETLINQDHALTSLAACQASRTVYAGSSDGLVNFWQRERHFMTYGGVLRGHKAAVLCVAAAGKFILSGSADKSICVWQRDTGGVHLCVRVLTGHTGPVKCLAMEKDGSSAGDDEEEEEDGSCWNAYSGSLDGSVKVWKLSE